MVSDWGPVDGVFVLCDCCERAGCDQVMSIVADAVVCPVCGGECQCRGCAAHFDSPEALDG